MSTLKHIFHTQINKNLESLDIMSRRSIDSYKKNDIQKKLIKK